MIWPPIRYSYNTVNAHSPRRKNASGDCLGFPSPPHSLEGGAYCDADDAENALAAAARLDHRGDWNDAISLYQSIEERWPEHANYVHNCIRDIERKRSARS